MSFETWALFALTDLLLCLTPGPAVIFVITRGMRGNRRNTLSAAAGIMGGEAIYFFLSALGVGALILSSHLLFTTLKYAGAAYLVWLGLRLVLDKSASPLQARAGGEIKGGFRKGVILQLANPKSLLFFGAILPVFIDPAAPLVLQVAILGATSMGIEFATLVAYGFGAMKAGRLISQPGVIAWFDRACGGILVSLGVSLAFWRRADS